MSSQVLIFTKANIPIFFKYALYKYTKAIFS